MFTIKVVESRNQSEVVFEATQVRKVLNEDPAPYDSDIGKVYCDLPDGGQCVYGIRPSAAADGSNDQTMYVMNRFGATVSTFHL
jgi:hypothetical protein